MTAPERDESSSLSQARDIASSDEARETKTSIASVMAIPQREQAVDAGMLGHSIDTTTSISPASATTQGSHILEKHDATAQTSTFSPAAYNLAPPLGVFNEVTPIAGEKPSVLSGGIVPAKTENPVEVIPVQELKDHAPFLGTPAVAQLSREVERDHSDVSYPRHEVVQEGSATPGLSSRSESTDNNASTGKLDAPSAARSDSSASVTAIKHGHLGQHHPEESSHTLGSISEKGKRKHRSLYNVVDIANWPRLHQSRVTSCTHAGQPRRVHSPRRNSSSSCSCQGELCYY